jgi:flavin-dependent dehydrogenase
VESQWILGADGERSSIRSWASTAAPRHEQVRFGSRQHFRVAPWRNSFENDNFVEVYWAENCQLVVTPVAPDELGVSVVARDPRMRLGDALRQVPELAQRLAGALPISRLRGARCALRILRRVQRGNVALIGDASGSVDPLTGEGLGLAFKQAAALSEALAADDLRIYQRAHDEISQNSRLMSRLLLAMDAHPSLRRRAFRALAAKPHIFASLLNAHVQAVPQCSLGIAETLRLGWTLIASGSLTAGQRHRDGNAPA